MALATTVASVATSMVIFSITSILVWIMKLTRIATFAPLRLAVNTSPSLGTGRFLSFLGCR